MNSWINAAQYAIEVLAIILIFRLLSLRERRASIYHLFVWFLTLQLCSTLAYFLYTRFAMSTVDYRILWMCFTASLAFLSLLLVYSLAKTILSELPGIFRFSRNLLNFVFPVAIVIAFATVRGEYGQTNAARDANALNRLVTMFFVMDRAISMAAVLVLLIILAFILWFPVRMSRNLAIFSVGFVIYFASKTGLELLHSYSELGNLAILGALGNLVLVLCFLYWIVFIDPKKQTVEVRLGHGWDSAEQTKLLKQLESLNVVLLRNSQRL